MIPSPIFADSDVGRYTTTDQITWKTTLDNIPYVPADKTGKNATSVSVFPDHNPMSHFEQYNFNIENEFRSILVEVGYAGSRGVHLQYGAYNLNAIPLALSPVAQGRFIAPFLRYPQYPNGVTSQSWIGSSNYNALQIKAERRFASGLGFQRPRAIHDRQCRARLDLRTAPVQSGSGGSQTHSSAVPRRHGPGTSRRVL